MSGRRSNLRKGAEEVRLGLCERWHASSLGLFTVENNRVKEKSTFFG